jgi:hypothetical protein
MWQGSAAGGTHESVACERRFALLPHACLCSRHQGNRNTGMQQKSDGDVSRYFRDDNILLVFCRHRSIGIDRTVVARASGGLGRQSG